MPRRWSWRRRCCRTPPTTTLSLRTRMRLRTRCRKPLTRDCCCPRNWCSDQRWRTQMTTKNFPMRERRRRRCMLRCGRSPHPRCTPRGIAHLCTPGCHRTFPTSRSGPRVADTPPDRQRNTRARSSGPRVLRFWCSLFYVNTAGKRRLHVVHGAAVALPHSLPPSSRAFASFLGFSRRKWHRCSCCGSPCDPASFTSKTGFAGTLSDEKTPGMTWVAHAMLAPPLIPE